MLGNAKLTNLLTKGTFYAQDPDGNATADNVLAVCIQQEGESSDNYNTVLKLIADGYAIYKADGTVKNAAAFTLKSDALGRTHATTPKTKRMALPTAAAAEATHTET